MDYPMNRQEKRTVIKLSLFTVVVIAISLWCFYAIIMLYGCGSLPVKKNHRRNCEDEKNVEFYWVREFQAQWLSNTCAQFDRGDSNCVDLFAYAREYNKGYFHKEPPQPVIFDGKEYPPGTEWVFRESDRKWIRVNLLDDTSE